MYADRQVSEHLHRTSGSCHNNSNRSKRCISRLAENCTSYASDRIFSLDFHQMVRRSIADEPVQKKKHYLWRKSNLYDLGMLIHRTIRLPSILVSTKPTLAATLLPVSGLS